MSWINYLLEANLYLALFYTAYYLLFRRETYYQLNRIYLLSSSVLAFLIPIFQLGFLKPIPVTTQVSLATIPKITAASPQVPIQIILQPYVVANHAVNYYLLIYITIALLLALCLAVRLLQLFKLAKRGNRDAKQDFTLIEIDEDDRAFSFFNYLFIGKKLTASDTVIRHEMVHIKQRHSIDIIYLELLKIICWFNPFVYLMQHSIKEIHEFIADSHISATGQDIDAYTDFLISNAYGLPETSLTNNFFNKNLLKNRIMMLHQKQSGSLARLKYLVALPLLAGMLCLSTLGFTKDYPMVDLIPAQQKLAAGPIVHTLKVTFKPQTQAPSVPPSLQTTSYIDASGYGVIPVKAGHARGKRLGELPQVPAAPSAIITTDNSNDPVLITNNQVAPDSSRGNATESIVTIIGPEKLATIIVNRSIADRPQNDFTINNKLQNTISSKINVTTVPLKRTTITTTADTSKKLTPPKPKVDRVGTPPKPKVAAKKSANERPANPGEFTALYKQLMRTIHYPAAARDKNIQGRVFVAFDVSNSNKIQNVRILRSPGDMLSDEVVRALTSAKLSDNIKQNVTYTLPIAFEVLDLNSDKPVQSSAQSTTSHYKETRGPQHDQQVDLSEVVITASK